jgi:prepilin-type N-terminal cleavage/methylation domain-containing protein
VKRRIETKRKRGFSLLEMLVALTVLGLLMAGLNEGVRTGLGLWNAQTRHVGGIAQLDSTARLLRSLLVSIPWVRPRRRTRAARRLPYCFRAAPTNSPLSETCQLGLAARAVRISL